MRSNPFVAVELGAAAAPRAHRIRALRRRDRCFTGAPCLAGWQQFERADGGTLFLDEKPASSPPPRAKLLQRLARRARSERLGDERSAARSARAPGRHATNVDLQAAVKAGRFRGDSRSAGSVVPGHHPAPARAVLTDIPPMVRGHAAALQRLHDKHVAGSHRHVRLKLHAALLPSANLENIIERGSSSPQERRRIEIEHLFTESYDDGERESTWSMPQQAA